MVHERVEPRPKIPLDQAVSQGLREIGASALRVTPRLIEPTQFVTTLARIAEIKAGKGQDPASTLALAEAVDVEFSYWPHKDSFEIDRAGQALRVELQAHPEQALTLVEGMNRHFSFQREAGMWREMVDEAQIRALMSAAVTVHERARQQSSQAESQQANVVDANDAQAHATELVSHEGHLPPEQAMLVLALKIHGELPDYMVQKNTRLLITLAGACIRVGMAQEGMKLLDTAVQTTIVHARGNALGWTGDIRDGARALTNIAITEAEVGETDAALRTAAQAAGLVVSRTPSAPQAMQEAFARFGLSFSEGEGREETLRDLRETLTSVISAIGVRNPEVAQALQSDFTALNTQLIHEGTRAMARRLGTEFGTIATPGNIDLSQIDAATRADPLASIQVAALVVLHEFGQAALEAGEPIPASLITDIVARLREENFDLDLLTAVREPLFDATIAAGIAQGHAAAGNFTAAIDVLQGSGIPAREEQGMVVFETDETTPRILETRARALMRVAEYQKSHHVGSREIATTVEGAVALIRATDYPLWQQLQILSEIAILEGRLLDTDSPATEELVTALAGGLDDGYLPTWEHIGIMYANLGRATGEHSVDRVLERIEQRRDRTMFPQEDLRILEPLAVAQALRGDWDGSSGTLQRMEAAGRRLPYDGPNRERGYYVLQSYYTGAVGSIMTRLAENLAS